MLGVMDLGLLPALPAGMDSACTAWIHAHVVLLLGSAACSFTCISPHSSARGRCSLLGLCPAKQFFLLTISVVPALSKKHKHEGFCGVGFLNKSLLRNGFVLNPQISVTDVYNSYFLCYQHLLSDGQCLKHMEFRCIPG